MSCFLEKIFFFERVLIVTKAVKIGNNILTRLKTAQKKMSIVGDVHNKRLMIGVILVIWLGGSLTTLIFNQFIKRLGEVGAKVVPDSLSVGCIDPAFSITEEVVGTTIDIILNTPYLTASG